MPAFVFCRFFNSHDREFHVASLPYKPDFKVMPEGWDGTTRDPDEVHYEISMKEDEMLYQEFVQRMNFNKMKVTTMTLAFVMKILISFLNCKQYCETINWVYFAYFSKTNRPYLKIRVHVQNRKTKPWWGWFIGSLLFLHYVLLGTTSTCLRS